MALGHLLEARGAEVGRVQLVRHALVHQVVAGGLEQQRHPPAGADAPPGGLEQAGGQPQQRGLARAVAAHERHPFAGRQPQVDAPQRRPPPRPLEPHALEVQRRSGGGAAAQPQARKATVGRARLLLVGRAGQQPLGAQRRASLLHAGGRRAQARPREQLGARRLQRRRRHRGPFQELPWRRVAGDGPAGQRDHSIGRRQAALEAMLGQQDRGPPLLVEPAQEPDELVARHRVQLRGGLVERQEARARRQRGGQRDALQLAAGELVGGAVQQLGDPQGQRRLLHAPRHRSRPVAAVLQRQGDLRSHRPHEHLGLGLLQDGPAHAGQRGRTVLAGVHPTHLHAPRDVPSVEVRDQSAGGAHQRGLAGARQPAHHRELPVGKLQLDAAQRRPGGAWVAVGQALDPQGAHRTTPRRSRKGASAAASSATASATAWTGAPRLSRG